MALHRRTVLRLTRAHYVRSFPLNASTSRDLWVCMSAFYCRGALYYFVVFHGYYIVGDAPQGLCSHSLYFARRP